MQRDTSELTLFVLLLFLLDKVQRSLGVLGSQHLCQLVSWTLLERRDWSRKDVF